MKLIELLEVANDHTKIEVWFDVNVIGCHNGRDSIPAYYNNSDVVEIFNAGGYFVVDVDLDSIEYIKTFDGEKTTLGEIFHEYISNDNDYDSFEEFLDVATDMGGDLREV